MIMAGSTGTCQVPPPNTSTERSFVNESLPDPIRSWPELTVRLDRLPVDVTKSEIHHWLSAEGEVVYISLFDPHNNLPQMSARVVLEPPPKRAFWKGGPTRGTITVQRLDPRERAVELEIHLTILPPNPPGGHVVRQGSYPLKLVLQPLSIDFGTMIGPASMKALTTITAIERADIRLEINTTTKKITAFFPVSVRNGDQRVVRKYKFIADLSLTKTSFIAVSGDARALVIPFPYPPQYYWKIENNISSLSSDNYAWSARELWYRATEIMEDMNASMTSPVALQNDISDSVLVGIGRWTSFRFVLSNQTGDSITNFSHIIEALQDLNINIITSPVAIDATGRAKSIWDHLDHRALLKEANALDLLSPSLHTMVALPFEVRYQLEVCVSRGVLNDHTISVDFLQQLAAMDSVKARLRLEYLADQDEPLYEPSTLLTSPDAGAYLPHLRYPHYCTLVRKAVITPTTMRFNSATLETSNRVIRKYNHVSDRFLRVQFVEEGETGRIAGSLPQNDRVWERVTRTLFEGIRIGDRRYEFLAFGSSQMRQSGVYFFCPTDHISCDDIRKWMGEFKHIKVVAKHAARLGQCLSTTREIRGVSIPTIRPIPDINASGYCFTDGVGIVSDFLRQMIIEEMALDVFDEPSAFQFRMGGCKGVLAVWPQAKGLEVQVRQSQEKFKAAFNGLEIIKCANFATATLNRQTITILEFLGVPPRAFLDLLDQQLRLYEAAMTDNNAAIQLLTRFVDENQTSLVIAELLRAGFRTTEFQEPFVSNVLSLWRSWSLKLLKEKARIQVEKSAFVLGCVDETKTLRGHSTASEDSNSKDVNQLPQIFLQLTDPNKYDKPRIITGVCIVGRNPSLHPGDIRVVQAVDNQKLRHLKDVVVFPAIGDRPVPDMLSGGDLDGDDFFVIWEPTLIPKRWNYPPMDYEGLKPEELERDVNVNDLKHFFIRYLRNDTLPLIAISHLAYADRHGPESPLCKIKPPQLIRSFTNEETGLDLAARHSQAVDFPKSGQPASWDRNMMPERWPHFMEKRKSYHSVKVLGAIYKKVAREPSQFQPDLGHAFDQRVLERFQVEEEVLQAARTIKAQYDTAVTRLLVQHSLGTEFELWTAFALGRPVVGSDYKRQEDLGREYDVLKQRFRDICYVAAGGSSGEKLDPFVAAMYKVTEEETGLALRERQQQESDKLLQPDSSSMPLISFPWMFHWVMVRLAMGGRYESGKSLLAAARRSRGSARSSRPIPGDLANCVDQSTNHRIEQAAEVPTKLADGTVVERGQLLTIFDEDGEGVPAASKVGEEESGEHQSDGIEEEQDEASGVGSRAQGQTTMERFAKLIDLDEY